MTDSLENFLPLPTFLRMHEISKIGLVLKKKYKNLISKACGLSQKANFVPSDELTQNISD